ncbi:MAG TPA: excisionase family DNA-binding protein [Acetobacteraceae bacterium]|nr:excisionase family DNA-binding protein [Acetobacteraceae bacterium]
MRRFSPGFTPQPAESLAAANGTVRLRLEAPNAPKEAVTLPAVVLRLLLTILNEMGNTNTVRVIPGHAELTTGEVAELLNRSRPYAIKPHDDKQIPSHRVGTHRRARLKDIPAYREEHYQARTAILDRMPAIDQELGLI